MTAVTNAASSCSFRLASSRSSPIGDRQFVGGAGILVARMEAISFSAFSDVSRLGESLGDTPAPSAMASAAFGPTRLNSSRKKLRRFRHFVPFAIRSRSPTSTP